ncbi:threonine--tRNA ligase, putative [Entamoeba histolytica HM-1:IMSS-B]|uniref:Probable threonine--tRNA ligase, cytoplasmic n=6 Tax=Entamoeba histolytica TaxID=5759 RepID=C4LVL5_ENTH1|nr:threonyl-tRNA synthetase, putative [Entamoeba histolytica HM-1:IMSS]EMD45965.1 threonyl-tRNA synthetase cytoplasmic, putative [Entamoeba histolytica KU27]EMH76745.1 threonine--tRNA ligase, putative [Entamoeba histolytica HM-1:IMSS-B]EMS15985.1 threonyl-tRNA synthetase, cytoplasmic, putative [Entamoeba histolytica HM-3:IMSS]ENY65776.1 threonyl-tRNA synthetase, cytoplasmic, putative [Entamoeba histolytica HM-1:IMSS-A]GAT92714.1 threonyl-tRNA synthetase putative [Entamoeba histolytica]|eukprot:XP_653365.1 threonyl-tRNA synthetase, putative [Entamoeba histolytica HM-1:IMSS]
MAEQQEPIIDCSAALEGRLNYFNELEKKYKEEELKKSKEITIKYKDMTFQGKSFVTSPQEFIKDLVEKGEITKENPVFVAKVNGKLWDLTRPFEEDSTVEYLGFDNQEAHDVFWHSSAHLLGEAMETQYKCYLHTGPATAIDFFYDCKMNGAISAADFKKLQSLIEGYVREHQVFTRIEITKEEALKMFAYNPYKVKIIEKLPEGSTITAYKNGSFVDLCRGPHLANAASIKAIKILSSGSVHLDGTATGDLLQRIHAVSFPTKDLLKEYIKRAEEADKRDHRLIGRQQDLFFFHVLSPGSCFWLPHGTRIYNKLVELMRSEYRVLGYQEVITPNIFLSTLWETSGHWQHYKDDMFSFECEKQTFALKPMNCPGHCVMFASKKRSYRELPLRYAEFGVLHRNELTGALHGLTRVRRFVQDDSHIFCTMDQIESEVTGVLNLMKKIYKIFGFKTEIALSTRNEKKFMGEIETWNKAEAMLTQVLNDSHLPFVINAGDGAFYGPKIDIRIEDALGRKHQVATVQLDFQLPLRFKLDYMSEDPNQPLKTPVMVHRAVLGSIERFTAILTEHLAGKWPFWLSPRQVMVCTVSEKYNEYGAKVTKELNDAGFYADLDDSDNKLPKKIRNAQVAQYNFILVIGEEELVSNSVNVRTRENKVEGKVEFKEFIKHLKQLEADKQ